MEYVVRFVLIARCEKRKKITTEEACIINSEIYFVAVRIFTVFYSVSNRVSKTLCLLTLFRPRQLKLLENIFYMVFVA